MNAKPPIPSSVHRALPSVESDAWQIARRVHRSFLPQRFLDERVDVAAHYEEHDVLGSDYGAVLKRTDDHLFLSVCDVTGHGLPAALLAGRINSFVQHEINVARHPCQVVDMLNRFVVEHFSGLGIYATFLCLEIDLRCRTIAYAGAGHPPALLHRRCGTIESLGSLSPLIGVFPEMGRECQVSKTFFAPGDRLLLFTDGLTKTCNPAGDILGIDGMSGIFRDLGHELDSAAILAEFVAARRRFARHEIPDDDVMLIVARFSPSSDPAVKNEPRFS